MQAGYNHVPPVDPILLAELTSSPLCRSPFSRTMGGAAGRWKEVRDCTSFPKTVRLLPAQAPPREGSGPSGRHSLGTPAAVWSQEGTREGGFSGCGRSTEMSHRTHLFVRHRLHISEKLGLTYMSEASGGFQGLWEEPQLMSVVTPATARGGGWFPRQV